MILINAAEKNSLKIFQPFLPPFLPISIGFLLAETERQGIKVEHIDEYVENDVIGLVEKYVKNFEPPYIFGFSVLTAALKNALYRSRQLRKLYPDSVIIFGGVHPTGAPEEILQHDHIDIVFKGEADTLLPKLYRHIKEGLDYSNIPNISFRKAGKIVHNEREKIIKDISELPPFPYHLFSPKHYDMGIIVSSRGCPYKCIFCSNRVTTGLSYRYIPPNQVVEQLEMLNKNYGITHTNFLDDNFLVNKNRIYVLLDAIKEKDLHKKMTFDFQARGDNVNYQILKDLYDGGFDSISFGIETASEDLMKIIQKGETVKECVDAVKMSKSIGYFVAATYIFGWPGETHNDRMKAAEISREAGIDVVRFNNATPYPGTPLYEIAKNENRLNIVGDYENFTSVSTLIENPFKKIPFSYVPEGSTEKELRQDILMAYLLFFFDYKRLKGVLNNPLFNLYRKKGSESSRGTSPRAKSKKNPLIFIKKIPSFVVLFFLLCVKFAELVWNVLTDRKSSIKINDFNKALKNLLPL